MKLSVIIPVYNAEETIVTCLHSILSNTCDFEVIAVDDGSSDESGKILDREAAADSRIRVFHQKNQGNSLSRDLAIQESSGDYIVFADADDRLEPGALDALSLRVSKSFPDILIYGYYTDFLAEHYSLKTQYPDRVFENSYQAAEFFLENGGFYLLWNKIYRADLIRGHHDFPVMKTNGQDFIFNCSVFPRARKIESISEVFYHYEKRLQETMVTRYLKDGYGNMKRKRDALDSMLASYGESADQVYADVMLKEYQVYVLNFFVKECPLTRKQKIEEVRKVVYQPAALRLIRKANAPDPFSRMFQKHALNDSPSGMVNAYAVLCWFRDSFGPIYRPIRQKIYQRSAAGGND